MRCCAVALLRCCAVALLRCCAVALLRCCAVALLRCCAVFTKNAESIFRDRFFGILNTKKDLPMKDKEEQLLYSNMPIAVLKALSSKLVKTAVPFAADS